MLLLLLAQSPFVLTGPTTQLPERVNLRQSGCRGPEAIVRTETDADLDADGAPESTDVTTNRYDARGNRSISISRQHSSTFGRSRPTTQATGSSHAMFWLDLNGDGDFEITTTTDSTYDASGRLATERHESTDFGGVNVNLLSYTYNARAPDAHAVFG